jgi:hypothetical protein
VFEIAALGPRPAKALEEFLAEEFSFLFHGRFCLGLSGCGQRRGASSKSGGLDEISTVRHGAFVEHLKISIVA